MVEIVSGSYVGPNGTSGVVPGDEADDVYIGLDIQTTDVTVRRLSIHGFGHDNTLGATLSEEADIRTRLRAPAVDVSQDLYVSGTLKSARVMVKDEDVCLHCGLCAERCPTGAWDMQKFLLEMTDAGPGCRSRHRKAA